MEEKTQQAPQAQPAAQPAEGQAMAALVAKIANVIKDVGAVPKTGKNEHFGYAYRKHEDIANAVAPALQKNGVLIIPEKKEFVIKEAGYVMIDVTYRVTDGFASLYIHGIGEGKDVSRDGKPGDKATYKAQTGAMKYALNDLLMLPSEADPENDHGHGEGTQPAGKPTSQGKPPAGKPATPPQGKTAAPAQGQAAKPAASAPAQPPAGKPAGTTKPAAPAQSPQDREAMRQVLKWMAMMRWDGKKQQATIARANANLSAVYDEVRLEFEKHPAANPEGAANAGTR